ncbi:MAG: TetR/AcrR family transcriptional regulator [Variibacter sp.]|nr:TetR/AcrR family transcriptional regulator [Variibacter sp.]
MAYRKTEKVRQRLAARREDIIAAARALAATHGMDAVQIAPVAERAGIAAGTVYRYFPSKTALVEALVEAVAQNEIAAMRAAADGAPGPLSGLAAAIVTFAARARRQRRLIWALTAEPVDAEVDRARLAFRKALAGEIEYRLKGDHGGEVAPRFAAPAVLGALLEGLIGPLAPDQGSAKDREVVQMLALLTLRGLGIADARARGLVVQAPWPAVDPDPAGP